MIIIEYAYERLLRHIEQVLHASPWRIAETAAAPGISRKNLWEKMRKPGIAGEEA